MEERKGNVVLDRPDGGGRGLDLPVGISLLSWAPQLGGSARYALELIKALLGLADGGRLVVLCNGHAARRLPKGHPALAVRTLPFSAARSAFGRGLTLLRGLLPPPAAGRRFFPGAALVHYPLTVALPPFAGPTVLTLHDLQHRALPEHWSKAGLLWRRLAYDRAAERATVVVTDSEFSKRQICETLSVTPERVVVAHLAVDHRAYAPDPSPLDEEVAARLKLPDRFLLYPAGFWPHKNHRRLIEAFARVGERTVALLFTGTATPLLGELTALAERLGVGERVRYLGFVADRDLPSLYRRALAVVFPSLYEGFGLPPLEAMACGTPVAASKAGSLGEVLGRAALELDPEDPAQMATALERLVGDERLRAELAEAGRARAARFSWQRTAERHLDAYRLAVEVEE